MRIAVDSQSALGTPSGIGQYTARLLAELRLIAPHHEFLALDWGRSPAMRLDRRLRWQQWDLPRRARAARCGLLHVPGFDAPLFKPCPVVLTVHDLIGVLMPETLPPASRFYWGRWLLWTVRRADRVITDSRHSRDDVVRLLGIPAERISVIPLGVDASFAPARSSDVAVAEYRQRAGLPDEFILFVGNIEPRKGIDTLVEAFGALAPVVPHHLVIAGSAGWYMGRLEEQIRALGLEARVRLLGYVSSTDLPLLYNAADVFAYPSRYEGFGLPPLEAMASGLPVVCSNTTSLPEVVGDGAVAVAPDDAAALQQALKRVLDDRSLHAELAARGLQRAAAFTWQATARRTLAVYESLP